MRSGSKRTRRPGAIVACLALGSIASCSLLAPSDEEAMRGLTPPASDGGSESAAADARDGTVAADAADARPTGPTSSDCATCPSACNGTTKACAGCLLNGGKCRGDFDCCTGKCTAGTCGPPAGACVGTNLDCSPSPDNCCAGESCSVERGNRCAACTVNGDNCKADTDCCSVHCGGDGKCAPCILGGGSGCGSNRQCCSGTCNTSAGTCG